MTGRGRSDSDATSILSDDRAAEDILSDDMVFSGENFATSFVGDRNVGLTESLKVSFDRGP